MDIREAAVTRAHSDVVVFECGRSFRLSQCGRATEVEPVSLGFDISDSTNGREGWVNIGVSEIQGGRWVL